MVLKYPRLFASFLLAVAAPGWARHEGEYLHQVSTELATPCVPFAQPYAQGPLKVLFLAPRTFCAREIVELWQRFDLEFEAVTFAHSSALAATDVWENAVLGGTPEEKLAELRTKLEKPYDAIVLGNVAFDAIPIECQYTILRRVSEGTGLLLAYNLGSRLNLWKKPAQEGREDLLTGVPWSGLDLVQTPEFQREVGVSTPESLPEKLVGTYHFHQGRIVTLNWPGGGSTWYGGSSLTPREMWSLHWDANYDHYLALVAQALLWAAPRKAPRVIWTSFPPDGAEMARAQLPGEPWRVGLRTPEEAMAGELRITIRSHDNRPEFEKHIATLVPPTGVEVPIPLPRLPCGGHYLDLAFVSPQGVEQWGAAFFRVTDAVRLAECVAEPECVERGKPITGRVTLTAPATEGMAVRFELVDTFGRLIGQKEVPLRAGQTEASISFDSRAVLSIAQILSAELWAGEPEYGSRGERRNEESPLHPHAGSLVERASAFVFVPRRHTEEFPMTLWGAGGRSGLGMIVNRQYRSVGFNAILAHPSPDGLDERMQAIANLAPVPYSYRIMIDTGPDGTAQDGWLRDVADGTIANLELRQAAKATVLERLKNVVRYGPPYYTLGDENYFTYYPKFSASDLAAFRQFLQREYRDLQDLNDHWGTDFADWNAVEPVPDAQAAREGRFAAIHDRKSYLESQYAFYHEWLREAIRSADPGARVGAEGSVPGDLEKTIANLEVWSPYMDRRGDVLLLSLAKPGLVRGMWWGGYVLWRPTRHDALVLWDQLLRGAANCNFFYCSQGSEGVMAPAMNWARYFQAMLPGFEELRSGIGQMLAESELADDGVYIHYSMANVHAAGLCTPFGSCEAAQDVVFNLLDELCLNYRFITRKQIEAGELLRRGVKLLLLPGAQCLSDAEAAEIRRFVEAGGMALADVDVGTRDEHLKERAQGVLDDLFGITREGPKQPVETALDLALDLGGGPSHRAKGEALLPFVARQALVDASVKGASALGRAAGGQPVFFLRPVGRGTAVLLNFDLPRAVGTQPPEARKNAARLLGALAARAGVRPTFTVDTTEPLQARMLTRGRVRYLGIWHLYPTEGGATVRLAEPAFVYDVRRGQALGRTGLISIPDGRDWPRLYALLPAGGTALRMAVDSPTRLGRPVTVKLTLEGPAPEGRVIRLRVFGPDGRERECYRRYPRLPGPSLALAIPLALNDPAGKWTLRARDVATGATAEANLEVSKG